jgi:hypothetical protein
MGFGMRHRASPPELAIAIVFCRVEIGGVVIEVRLFHQRPLAGAQTALLVAGIRAGGKQFCEDSIP